MLARNTADDCYGLARVHALCVGVLFVPTTWVANPCPGLPLLYHVSRIPGAGARPGSTDFSAFACPDRRQQTPGRKRRTKGPQHVSALGLEEAGAKHRAG